MKRTQNEYVTDIDTSRFTHIHFSFIDVSHDYQIYVADNLKAQFGRFKAMRGVKRIVAFGGWTASTHPSTFMIFREGVKAANRAKLATNVYNFLIEHGLDGVDFDWEYPAAPDLPDIPEGDAQNGPDYREFLASVRRRIGTSKSLSIAAPASYWYLKGFPIKEIAPIVDYIVYMTYDLHGQWDYNNKWSNPGCPTGNCLRSHVNSTETHNALVMITKAGVPSNKVIVGVTSYGRSFQMADKSCVGVMCRFTGDSKNSRAQKGWCTDTAGYISDAEIAVIKTGKYHTGVRRLNDRNSDSQILVWEDNWVAYMDKDNKDAREKKYRGLNFGGTTDWAIDLESFSPFDSGSPGMFFEKPGDDDNDNKLSKCNFYSWSSAERKYMANKVSEYLYDALRNDNSNTTGWMDKRWCEGGDGVICAGAGCGDLDGGGCTYPGECFEKTAENWWIMTKGKNFIGDLRRIKSSVESAWINGTYYNDRVLKSLPMNGKEPSNPATLISVLANFGNSFAVLGTAIPHPAVSTWLGLLSAVLSLAKDNIVENESEQQDMNSALNSIWSQYKTALDKQPAQMFTDGDITSWPQLAFEPSEKYPVPSKANGRVERVNRIVNFFHDRFWLYNNVETSDMALEMTKNFKQFIINFALAEGNYYIIKGGYPQAQCSQQNTGRWLNGACFTLEHQNGGSDPRTSNNWRSQYSIPIDNVKTEFLAEKPSIEWEQVFINSEDCQTHQEQYFGSPSHDFDSVLSAYDTAKDGKCTAQNRKNCLPECTWNLPVLTVKEQDANYRGIDAAQSSPCRVRMGPSPKIPGKNFLPDRLDKWFDQYYCAELRDSNGGSRLTPPSNGTREPGEEVDEI